MAATVARGQPRAPYPDTPPIGEDVGRFQDPAPIHAFPISLGSTRHPNTSMSANIRPVSNQ